MSHDLGPLLGFLGQLDANNNKAWFEANRARFERARDQFEGFVGELIARLPKEDRLAGLEPRACLGRMNRDTRFSKDKSPYNPALGAAVAPGGRSRATCFPYHIYIRPHDRTLVAGGMYMPESAQLKHFRATIAANSAPLRDIAAHPDVLRHFGGISGDVLKTAPRDFPRDHPDLDLLRLKQVIVVREFTDNDVIQPGFLDEALACCLAMRPFLRYLDAVEADRIAKGG